MLWRAIIHITNKNIPMSHTGRLSKDWASARGYDIRQGVGVWGLFMFSLSDQALNYYSSGGHLIEAVYFEDHFFSFVISFDCEIPDFLGGFLHLEVIKAKLIVIMKTCNNILCIFISMAKRKLHT